MLASLPSTPFFKLPRAMFVDLKKPRRGFSLVDKSRQLNYMFHPLISGPFHLFHPQQRWLPVPSCQENLQSGMKFAVPEGSPVVPLSIHVPIGYTSCGICPFQTGSRCPSESLCGSIHISAPGSSRKADLTLFLNCMAAVFMCQLFSSAHRIINFNILPLPFPSSCPLLVFHSH